MRILLVSDSHGNVDFIKENIARIGKIDRVFHLGDYARDVGKIKEILDLPIDLVKGNNDIFDRHEEEKIIHHEGVTIFMTHGHKYGVYKGTDRLYYKGLEVGADLVLYGHTHLYNYDDKSDVIILNPGSISLPRDGKRSMVILEIEGKEIRVERIFD